MVCRAYIKKFAHYIETTNSLSLTPNPFPREMLCMLCWLCICATVVVCCRCVLHRLCSTTCMRPCIEPLGIHARRPCRGCVWGCRPHQARTLAVSRTQSLHDATTPTTDDLHWGYAPNPIFIHISSSAFRIVTHLCSLVDTRRCRWYSFKVV